MTDAAALDILLHGRRIGTVEQFDAVWDLEKAHLPFSGEVVAAINKHRKQLALYVLTSSAIYTDIPSWTDELLASGGVDRLGS